MPEESEQNSETKTKEKEIDSLSRIRSHLPELGNAESQVANWILHHASDVIHLSMMQVARLCNVSDTTVLRFCRNVGFRGYLDLKLSIARDLAKPTQFIHDAISEDDDIPTVTRKVFLSNIQAIQDTLEVIDYDALIRAIELIENARLILIIGVGTSGPIVHEFYNKLFRLGLNCRPQTDSYLQLMEVALVGQDDVVIGISQSGSSTDPVLTMEEAKRNGASTIVITGNYQSPITRYADVTLLSVSNETRAETISSRIAQMTIVDAIYVALSLRRMGQTIHNERKIWDAILPKTI